MKRKLTTIKCPSCGNRHRVALFPIQKTQRQSLESVQPFFSNSWFGRVRHFFWYMSDNRPVVQARKLVVRSEIRTSKHQMLINELEVLASTNDLRQLANIYVQKNLSWSRFNSTDTTRVTQPTHLKVQKTFEGLRFLERVNATQYTLTDAGYRFLRHFIDT